VHQTWEAGPVVYLDTKRPLIIFIETKQLGLIVLFLQRHDLASHEIALKSYGIGLMLYASYEQPNSSSRLHFSCLAAKCSLDRAQIPRSCWL